MVLSRREFPLNFHVNINQELFISLRVGHFKSSFLSWHHLECNNWFFFFVFQPVDYGNFWGTKSDVQFNFRQYEVAVEVILLILFRQAVEGAKPPQLAATYPVPWNWISTLALIRYLRKSYWKWRMKISGYNYISKTSIKICQNYIAY